MMTTNLPSICLANRYFDAAMDLGDISLPWRDAFTNNPGAAGSADALIFHVPDLSFGKPSLEEVLALQKPTGQVWVAWSMESAGNYPALDDPAFLRKFDILMTYRQSANIWLTYAPRAEAWSDALATPGPERYKTAPAVMFQSSPFNKSGRLEFATNLFRNLKVDSYGKVLHTRSLPSKDVGRETKLNTISQYKFCLSFENSIEADYVTEKFFDPLLAGSIPVYLGAPNVAEFAPGPHCYIDASQFGGPDELAAYLSYLDANDAARQSYLAWRKLPLSQSFCALLETQRTPPFEKLARMIQARLEEPLSEKIH